jgi:hypothetical protein
MLALGIRWLNNLDYWLRCGALPAPAEHGPARAPEGIVEFPGIS